MRIGIDARFWGIEHTGIGRYVMELVSNLQKIDKENEYVIFLRKRYFNQLKFTNPRFRKVLTDFSHYSFSEQFLFIKILKKEKLDLVHFPHFNLPVFYRGNFVVTIHDLIKHESRGPLTTTHGRFFYWFKFLAYLLVINFAIHRAKTIIVPSFWWEKRLRKKFALKKKTIRVTYESVGEEFKKLAAVKNEEIVNKVLKKHQIKTPFIVYTGNLYPHKNIVKLAEAVVQINQERKLYLVIVCAKGVFWQRFKKEVDQLKVSDFVILAGFVSDQELVCLYQAAEAFVFPSFLEGFGLPGLEAMSVGLPVVSSKASCLPEIYRQAAHFFNPKSANDIKTKILAVLDNKKLRNELIKKGHQRVKDFSWEKMAQETLEVYRSSFI